MTNSAVSHRMKEKLKVLGVRPPKPNKKLLAFMSKRSCVYSKKDNVFVDLQTKQFHHMCKSQLEYDLYANFKGKERTKEAQIRLARFMDTPLRDNFFALFLEKYDTEIGSPMFDDQCLFWWVLSYNNRNRKIVDNVITKEELRRKLNND